MHLWRIQGGLLFFTCPHAPQLTEKTLIHGGGPPGQMKDGRGGGVKPLPIPLVRWGITIYAWGGHDRGTCRRWGGFSMDSTNSVEFCDWKRPASLSPLLDGPHFRAHSWPTAIVASGQKDMTSAMTFRPPPHIFSRRELRGTRYCFL